MSLSLLQCSVCPKKPKFCDSSHLLTHIGSKGHLSSLHKLQVRSHKEFQAAADLAAYNQWYQEHNLGQLLSERLVQKEAKKAGKKVGPTKRNTRRPKLSVYVDVSDQSSPLQLRGIRTTRARTERRRTTGVDTVRDENPRDQLPVQVTSSYGSPQRAAISPTEAPTFLDDASPILDPALAASLPESLKPKGIQWPGMIMFDAASPEEKRRRNQRKEVSVAARLECRSKLVLPTEVVYSPSLWTMKKARHIDDLDDASSLIEGESPMMIQPQRKRRKPLVKRSVNIPRLVKRKIKQVEPKAKREAVDTSELPPLTYIAISSTSPIHETTTHDSPIKTEDLDYDMPINHRRRAKRQAEFEIYDDSTARQTTSMHFQRSNVEASYQANPIYGFGAHPRLSFPTVSWLQPQNQQHVYYANQQPSFYPTYSELQDTGMGKENICPFRQPLMNPHQSFNPLMWKNVSPGSHSNMHSPESPFTRMTKSFINTSHLEDPFAATKNPLMNAVATGCPEVGGSPTHQTNDSPLGATSEPSSAE